MLFLMPNQQQQSTEGKLLNLELNSSGAMQPTEHIGFKLRAWLCSTEYASEWVKLF